jgi:hypothetical protein
MQPKVTSYGVNWIELVQGGGQWNVFVMMVMNFSVSGKYEIL